MSDQRPALRAFEGIGIEIEFMIVDRENLSPLPIADRLLQTPAGVSTNEVDRGMLGWSNEMMLHVIEIKNLDPRTNIDAMPAAFQLEIRYINRMLELFGAQLMPTAMHPWMNPRHDARLWPHDHADLYRAFGNIFDYRTHGWANLQSMHINLPFADDAEFARLHAAVRLVLPILPAIAASSPLAEGRITGIADTRMEAYCSNAQSLSSIIGQVIPDTVSSCADYRELILTPMYRDVAPFDPQHLLQHEWLNSRGAIARFDRDAIEIRVVDTQECVHADLAIAVATVALVRTLYDAADGFQGDASGSKKTARRADEMLARQQAIGTDALAAILQNCIRDAERAEITDADYLALLGYPSMRVTADQLWRHLIERMRLPTNWRIPLETILEHGTLARRIVRAVQAEKSDRPIDTVYRQLCDCLQRGRMFVPT